MFGLPQVNLIVSRKVKVVYNSVHYVKLLCAHLVLHHCNMRYKMHAEINKVRHVVCSVIYFMSLYGTNNVSEVSGTQRSVCLHVSDAKH